MQQLFDFTLTKAEKKLEDLIQSVMKELNEDYSVVRSVLLRTRPFTVGELVINLDVKTYDDLITFADIKKGEKLTNDTISSLMNVSPETIRVAGHKGISKIQDFLSEDEDYKIDFENNLIKSI